MEVPADGHACMHPCQHGSHPHLVTTALEHAHALEHVLHSPPGCCKVHAQEVHADPAPNSFAAARPTCRTMQTLYPPPEKDVAWPPRPCMLTPHSPPDCCMAGAPLHAHLPLTS
eukprot:1158379-Pelagomonas_calceolata.AAC.1